MNAMTRPELLQSDLYHSFDWPFGLYRWLCCLAERIDEYKSMFFHAQLHHLWFMVNNRQRRMKGKGRKRHTHTHKKNRNVCVVMMLGLSIWIVCTIVIKFLSLFYSIWRFMSNRNGQWGKSLIAIGHKCLIAISITLKCISRLCC